MQVNCTKCSQPIALTDVVESHDGHLSHIDCKRPQVLTPEERTLVFLYCSGHVVAGCPICDLSFRYTELASDILGGSRTNMCPRCRQDLTEAVRAHLFRCAMLPSETRRWAQAVREAAQRLVKESHQLTDRADILMREAEAAVAALRETMQRTAQRDLGG